MFPEAAGGSLGAGTEAQQLCISVSCVHEDSWDGEFEPFKGRKQRTQLIIHIPALAELHRKGRGEVRP